MDMFVDPGLAARAREPLAPSSVSLPPLRKPDRVDGRRLRSERTRLLIIEAFLLLLREHPNMPTAVQIADRAGYSVRSVFQRFPDLHALRLAAADVAMEAAIKRAPARNVDGDRASRIHAQVETRAHTCEEWLPLWRALVAHRHESRDLEERVQLAREVTWKRMELMYAPELAALDEARRRRTLVALESLTDYESWSRMRHVHGLSVDEGIVAWKECVERILPVDPIS
ncbi:MAG: hypothetical protein FJX02_10295 [Alphaproteobacteria bacterium]|nr:hypothetical protein [Alphaproteobacteria bacterium]